MQAEKIPIQCLECTFRRNGSNVLKYILTLIVAFCNDPTAVMIKQDPHSSSGILVNIIVAACFNDGMSLSPGRRRRQCAVTAPDGGTIRVGSAILIKILNTITTDYLPTLSSKK